MLACSGLDEVHNKAFGTQATGSLPLAHATHGLFLGLRAVIGAWEALPSPAPTTPLPVRPLSSPPAPSPFSSTRWGSRPAEPPHTHTAHLPQAPTDTAPLRGFTPYPLNPCADPVWPQHLSPDQDSLSSLSSGAPEKKEHSTKNLGTASTTTIAISGRRFFQSLPPVPLPPLATSPFLPSAEMGGEGRKHTTPTFGKATPSVVRPLPPPVVHPPPPPPTVASAAAAAACVADWPATGREAASVADWPATGGKEAGRPSPVSSGVGRPAPTVPPYGPFPRPHPIFFFLSHSPFRPPDSVSRPS